MLLGVELAELEPLSDPEPLAEPLIEPLALAEGEVDAVSLWEDIDPEELGVVLAD